MWCFSCPGMSLPHKQPVIDSDSVYWIGYLLTDPKSEGGYYDISVDEARKLNLRDVPVIFNHNKQLSMRLGKIQHAWHDHQFGNPFSIAFLACIDNMDFLRSSASLMMLTEYCASLSTLEKDKSMAVEVSLCYCGARDNCIGLFVRGRRLADLLPHFGLEDYKRMSHLHRNDMSTSLEETLPSLTEDQYNVVKDKLTETQANLENVCSNLEKSHQIQDLIVSWIGSILSSRLAMESESNSEVAQKRRADMESLRERGILESHSDIGKINELMNFCNECFEDDSPSKKLASEVIDRFEKNFPQLKGKVSERGKVLQTVDAAFNYLQGEMKRKEASALDERNRKLNARAMELAKSQYDKINELDTSAERKSSASNMAFKDFLKAQRYDLKDLNSPPPPPPPSPERQRKRKRTVYEEDDDLMDLDVECRIPPHKRSDFLKKIQRARQEYDRYQDNYLKEEEQRWTEINKNMVSLIDEMRSFREQKQRQPPRPPQQQTENAGPSPQDQEARTIDASMTNAKNVLWDL